MNTSRRRRRQCRKHRAEAPGEGAITDDESTCLTGEKEVEQKSMSILVGKSRPLKE
jgi:hypothetical protein